MSARTFSLVAIASSWALACDPHGVSLGTEELCVADADLVVAAAESTEKVSPCAAIGKNQLINPGFEIPVVACLSASFCRFPVAEVDGWQTSSAAQVIEIWHDGYMDVPAPAGTQFVELNADSRDTLSQRLALPPGQLMYWAFVHRGRNGIEGVEVRIGSPDAERLQGVFSDPEDAWYAHSGLYRVGEDEPETRFALVSRTGAAEGNLVDSVVFAPITEP
jgi:hypothetical protein